MTVVPNVVIASEAPLFRPDLSARVAHFTGGILGQGTLGARSRSYDHCYNYFLATPRPTQDMEKSCAVLGFYLASWGMYRGSSYLFKSTNSSHFVPLIEYIEEHGAQIRAIDVDSYKPEQIELLLGSYADIKQLVLPGGNTALTLVTKILVCVFGSVPAYDTYFTTGMRSAFSGRDRESFSRFSQRSLELLGALYRANEGVVDHLSASLRTTRFSASSAGGFPLTKAKVLDMYGFDLGYHPSPVA